MKEEFVVIEKGHPFSKVIEVPLIINGIEFHINHRDIKVISGTLYPKYQILFIINTLGYPAISSFSFNKDSVIGYYEVLKKLVNNGYKLAKQIKEVEKYLPFE